MKFIKLIIFNKNNIFINISNVKLVLMDHNVHYAMALEEKKKILQIVNVSQDFMKKLNKIKIVVYVNIPVQLVMKQQLIA